MEYYENEILTSYQVWKVRVVIGGVVMCYRSGADAYHVMAWHGQTEKLIPRDWEECRKKWNTKQLSATDSQKCLST